MTELLKTILGHGSFTSGGLLLMIIGGLGVYLRAVPRTLWEWCLRQTTMMVTVKDDDAAFVWVKEWLLEQDFLKRIRRVDLDTTLRGSRLSLIPAPGRHWFWHAGRPFTVWFYRSEDSRGLHYAKRSESLTFRTIGRDQKFLKRFVDEIAESHERGAGEKSSLFVYDEYWTRVIGYVPRVIESVILNPGEKEHLIQDVESFQNSSRRYRQLGVPYHRGYLLHGPPGTGKTSLVSAVAKEFGMSIYAINLNEFNDRTLVIAINDVPPHSLILFEDIDCMGSGKTRTERVERAVEERGMGVDKNEALDRLGVTLSGLLNVLDGFSAPDNVLFVMTSNKIEALDAALLRPGRIDYRLYMGDASEHQKLELYRRFFPSATETEAHEFLEANLNLRTMAEFQGALLSLEQNNASADSLMQVVRA